MDLALSPAGLLVMGAGMCAFGTSVGYICFGSTHGHPRLLPAVGALGWLALAAAVVVAQLV